MAASSTGIEAGRAFLRLLLDDTDAMAAMTKFERRALASGQVLTSLGLRLGALSAGLSAPFVASIRAASAAQQTLQKFEQTFKEQSRAAQEFANTYTGSLITSQRVTQNTMADIYNQFLGLGASRDIALEYAKALTQAAADFESFQNLEPGDSIRRISSALAGEIEPVRRYGIDISDNAIDRRLKSQGVVGGTRSVDFLEKGLLRAQIILDTLGKQDVLGDVGRTFGQAENQIRSLLKTLDETAVQVGAAFIPIIEQATPPLVELVKAVGDFAAANPGLVTAVGGTVFTMTALSAVAIFVGTTLTSLGTIAGITSALLTKMAGSGAEAGAGATAAAAGAAAATQANTTWAASATIVIGTLYEAVAANYAQATSWYALAAATDVATAAQGRYMALSFAGGLAAAGGGVARLALPGPGGGVDPRTITSITTAWVKTNDASKAAWSLTGALKAIGAAVASQFPTVIYLANGVKTAIFGIGSAIAFIARGALAGLAGLFTPVGIALLAVTAIASYFIAEMWSMKAATDAEEESAEKAAAALRRLRDAIEESLSGPTTEDVAARLDAARDAAIRYADALDSLAEARRQLNALEAAGRGSSDEANNLRSRLNAEGRALPAIRAEAESKAEAADLQSLSRAANSQMGRAVAEYAQAVQQLNEAGKQQDAATTVGESDAAAQAVSVALARVRGSRAAIDKQFKQGDPAIQGIATALTDEVIGGTADDPQARLAEIKAQIEQFRRFYDEQVDSLTANGAPQELIDYAKQQAQKFAQLQEDAAKAVPSPIGGRDKPLIPGDPEDDKAIEREKQQRADDEADALSRARSSQIDLIENELERQLAEIQQQREEAIAKAEETGATPVAVNAINQQFDNEAELARRDAAKKAADQTAKLQLESDIAAIQADSKLSDAEKRIREINLRADQELNGEGLTDKDKSLINDRRNSDVASIVNDERDRLENEERRRIDQRRRLDISDVFTGSIATALAIGPPVDVQQQQLNVSKLIDAKLQRLIDIAQQGGGGIPGG